MCELRGRLCGAIVNGTLAPHQDVVSVFFHFILAACLARRMFAFSGLFCVGFVLVDVWGGTQHATTLRAASHSNPLTCRSHGPQKIKLSC